MALHGYPAVVDAGDSVALRVRDRAALAAAETRRGVRRLFALACAGELAFVAHELQGVDAAAVKLAGVCDRDALVGDVLDAAVDVTFIQDQPPARDADAFDRRLVDRGAQLQPVAEQVWSVVYRIIEGYHAARLALAEAPDAWRDLRADVNEQLGLLLPGRFASETPWPWLGQMPRYLRAIARRIEKARDGNIGTDSERLAELRPHWQAWLNSGETAPRPTNDALGQYRWVLEELRVSLFAQELGTAIKVSPKRMAEAARKAGVAVR
jgi:ATP-dependent helicase HrpA